ncbi:MAG: sigma 54-interacting transcriptional regulator, partial [candidate division WOR-3 bacterium]
ASLHWARRETAQARTLYERHINLQRKWGDVYYLLKSLLGIGLIRMDEADLEGAQRDFVEARRLADAIGSREDLNAIYSNLGLIHEATGDWDSARECFAEAQRLSVQLGDDATLCAAVNNLAGLAAKQGELNEAARMYGEALAIAQRAELVETEQTIRLEQARVELKRNQPVPARAALNSAIRWESRNRNPNVRLLIHTVAAEYRLHTGAADKALAHLRRLLSSDSPATSRERLAAAVLQGIALNRLGEREGARQVLAANVAQARSLRHVYELGQSLAALAGARISVDRPESLLRLKPMLAQESLDPEEIEVARREADEARTIFRRLGAKLDLKAAEELFDRIQHLQSGITSSQHSEYLRVFRSLSEMLKEGLDRSEILEKVLDLVIDATGAERGVLFLVKEQRLVPAVARDMDHTTLEDASTVSHTLVRQSRKQVEPLIASDALNDPRFGTSQSVKVNRIRSMLCAPLEAEGRTIGAIYVDSRINAHLFWEEDKTLLSTIANMVAATIERAPVFEQMSDELSTLREDILAAAGANILLGKSEVMEKVYEQVRRVAPTDCNILITGETGSGKGVLARLIHDMSKRRTAKFLSLNCGALTETLLESELFGHARGAFTGAVKDKEGLFEAASGGTLFLDEIANMSPGTQAKLLTAIEEKKIRRVGETHSRAVDIRLICSTNRDLRAAINRNEFREDLYFRLNVVELVVPPLRERRSDIPALAGYFLRRYAKKLNKGIASFDEGAMRVLTEYDWPGNVRELQNVVERATIMCGGRRITAADLRITPNTIPSEPTQVSYSTLPSVTPRRSISREELVLALRQCQGNVSHTALKLRISRRQVQRLIKTHKIDKSNPN